MDPKVRTKTSASGSRPIASTIRIAPSSTASHSSRTFTTPTTAPASSPSGTRTGSSWCSSRRSRRVAEGEVALAPAFQCSAQLAPAFEVRNELPCENEREAPRNYRHTLRCHRPYKEDEIRDVDDDKDDGGRCGQRIQVIGLAI